MPSTKQPTRSKSIKIRVTPQELEQLNERKTAALATWLRRLGLGAIPIKQADPRLIAAINRVGNTTNQIARNINTSGLQSADKDKLLDVLKQINDRLELIIQYQKEGNKNAS